MEELPYSKRELDQKFLFIEEKMDDLLDMSGRIENQTTKHNGRMTSMEAWRNFITGGMSVLVMIVLPLLAWALWVLVNIQGQVHQAVDDALSAYDISK